MFDVQVFENSSFMVKGFPFIFYKIKLRIQIQKELKVRVKCFL